MEKMKNIIRLKDVPSNTIEEAIIIFKDNKKAKKFEYTNKFKIDNEEKQEYNNYVVKEAELIISDYLESAEMKNTDIVKKNKRLKLSNIILGLLLIVSIIF